MKMNILRTIYCAVLLVSTSSCEKYLDIKTESKQVYITTSSDCQKLLDDYQVMNTGYPSDGETSVADYYLDDITGFGMLNIEDQSVYNWAPTAIRQSSERQWKPSYFKIYCSNLVLEALDKLKDNPDQGIIDGLRGSALFYRAFSLWQIAQLYTKPYAEATALQDLGIPIRLNSDINGTSRRGNLKETYDQIIQDLKESAKFLPPVVKVPSRPNKTAAFAMLARVYLSMADYPQALASANSALEVKSDLIDYNTINTDSPTPFSRFNSEVIFHAVMIQNWYLYSDPSFAIAKIDSSIVNSYVDSDLRKKIFFKALGDNSGYVFTGNYEPTFDGTLFVGLAVDELYLTRAECYARSGNVQAALTDLNKLLLSRWLTGTYMNINESNSDNVLKVILNERKKELVFRGQRWTDLRRLNKEGRFVTNQIRSNQNLSLPANDPRYTLLIPLEVIQNSGIIQNPR